MTFFMATLGVLTILSVAPAMAQTSAPAPMPAMNTLNGAERAELQNRYHTAKSEEERNKVRAQIHERVRTQDMLNRELAPGHRNQLTAAEQQHIRQRLGEANNEQARQRVINDAQMMVQERTRTRTENGQRSQQQNVFTTRPSPQNSGSSWGKTGRFSSGNHGGNHGGGGGSGSGGRR